MKGVHLRQAGEPIAGGWKIGDSRVSTTEQILDLQTDALKRVGCKQIYSEQVSAVRSARPELAACLKSLRPGDTLVVWRLDRLGRSVSELVRIVTDLETRGIQFESLTEKIDTGSASGRLMFHVFASFAEFERNLLQERTNAGIAAARARGRNGGRPRIYSDETRDIVIKEMQDPANCVVAMCKGLGISKSTAYRIFNNWKRCNG